jgi:hypothetical protein
LVFFFVISPKKAIFSISGPLQGKVVLTVAMSSSNISVTNIVKNWSKMLCDQLRPRCDGALVGSTPSVRLPHEYAIVSMDFVPCWSFNNNGYLPQKAKAFPVWPVTISRIG